MQADYTINPAGHLAIGGCDALELAHEFETPLVVYDVSKIRQTFQDLHATFEAANVDYVISYASKAFATVAMYQVVKQEHAHIDVVSGGELFTAMQANFPMANISFHGNNKSYEELTMAVDQEVGMIVVDNFTEIKMLQEILRNHATTANILLRITPGISAHTHEYIQTGQADSKFGFDLASGQAAEALQIVLADEHFKVCGIHAHIGSQIFESTGFVEEAKILVATLANWQTEYGFDAQVLNLGGGFGIRYTQTDEPKAPQAMLTTVINAVKEAVATAQIKMPAIWIEPGRAIVGPAGYSLYRVGTRKDVPGIESYITVDGGMGDNIRPALYQAEYEAVLAKNPQAPTTQTARLAGKYCESGDILIEHQALPDVEQGDVIAMLATGAYGYSMASNYNRNGRPAVVFAENGIAKVVVRRETYQDLVALDVSYE
ncbi:diaminopimelate decarboxylase [Periweissella ghanensis]|uniref:Diaminopimelate decarboxylase n=1 Tax=Periweissella ghanensis TaxID=467997 RepID=A0ABM8ZD17_9LACO|nr:diaminopimelate decarboxylase [Periweissella ghanensis]MCM0601284.1 diaminopimelate decarboxylase [Periweissella ghanensis]CAH0419346.1 Diaminopimelate decarboxylase [Periweissella ghanensis]